MMLRTLRRLAALALFPLAALANDGKPVEWQTLAPLAYEL